MTTMLDRAERFLRKKRGDHLAKTVTYTRAGGVSIPIKATPAATIVDVASGDVVVRSDVVDWLIDVREFRYYIGSCPLPGDTIEDGSNPTESNVYTVADLAGMPCYRHHGRGELTFRIHAKRTNNANNPRNRE